jgi:immune inhibitor A
MLKNLIRFGGAFLVFLVFTNFSLGVSFSPEAIEKLKKEGRWEEVKSSIKQAKLRGFDQPVPHPLNLRLLSSNSFNKNLTDSVKTVRALVILVDFSDHPSTFIPNTIKNSLFSKGVMPLGSMRDYYLENSYNKFDLIGDVVGWYQMPQTYAYYVNGQGGFGPYPNNAYKLVEDAIAAADPLVDFSLYDNDGDGWVDALFVVHSGEGRESTGDDNDMNSHASGISPVSYDGVTISSYSMEPEKQRDGLMTIGVFCHEFGHVLGLPDFYDYDYDSKGLGHWSLMAYGLWTGPANNGAKPVHYDAWCKAQLGFVNVDTIRTNQNSVQIPEVETNPKVFRLGKNGDVGPEYFLVENRRKIGFDQYLPGEGLLIYHVDDNIYGNDDQWYPGYTDSGHSQVALEQADGNYALELFTWLYYNNYGDTGDPFPGDSVKRNFDDLSFPSSRTYLNQKTEVAVWNISDADSVMTANFEVFFARPYLVWESVNFDDSTYGNNNQVIDAGEKVIFKFSLSNYWYPIHNARVIVSADTNAITFLDSIATIGEFLPDSNYNNFSSPIVFQIPSDFKATKVIFTFKIVGDNGYLDSDKKIQFRVGRAGLLLVDDNQGTLLFSTVRGYYTSALDSIGFLYDLWDKKADPISTFPLSYYSTLIWFTGSHRDTLFSESDVQLVKDFLDQGGKLFLTSQDIASTLFLRNTALDSIFLKDYLHIAAAEDAPFPFIRGSSSDVFGNELYLELGGAASSANNQNSPEAIIPGDSAFSWGSYCDEMYAIDYNSASIHYQGNFKLIFFSFGFEGISNSGASVPDGQHFLTKQKVVMQKVLDWLNGTSGVEEEHNSLNLPEFAELSQNFPNPFNPITTINFGLRQRAKVSFKIYNIKGELVRNLLEEEKRAGDYSIVWDGSDNGGIKVASGVYFYRLVAGESYLTKKMVLLK